VAIVAQDLSGDQVLDDPLPDLHAQPRAGRASGNSGVEGVLARSGKDSKSRKPLLLLRFVGWFLLRLAERTFLGLLFQEPPRRSSALHLHAPEGKLPAGGDTHAGVARGRS
jgi:hypothetical protein